MSIQEKRHYIHGDQQEDNTSLFYCSTCDVFFNEDHFINREDKCCDHWAKYDNAIKWIGASPKQNRDFGRPMNAPNVFTR